MSNDLKAASELRDEIVGMAMATDSAGHIRCAFEALPHVMRAIADIEPSTQRELVAHMIFGRAVVHTT